MINNLFHMHISFESQREVIIAQEEEAAEKSSITF